MTRLALITFAALLTASFAFAQKVTLPTGTGNPFVKVTPASQEDTAIAAAKRIGREEAMELVEQNKAVFVDVRSKESFDLGHIKGAISMPGSQLLARLKELPKDKTLIFYCACTAEHTAARAVVQLSNNGMKNGAALVGGWYEWTALGLPVEKKKL